MEIATFKNAIQSILQYHLQFQDKTMITTRSPREETYLDGFDGLCRNASTHFQCKLTKTKIRRSREELCGFFLTFQEQQQIAVATLRRIFTNPGALHIFLNVFRRALCLRQLAHKDLNRNLQEQHPPAVAKQTNSERIHK